MTAPMIVNIPKEPAGYWKDEVMCLSMDLAWSNWKEPWLIFIDIMIPADHRGNTLMSAFRPST